MKFTSSKLKETEYKKYIRGLVNTLFTNARKEYDNPFFKQFRDSIAQDVENTLKRVLSETYDPIEVQSYIDEYFRRVSLQVDRRIQSGLGVRVALSNEELLLLIISQNVQLVTTLLTDSIKDLGLIINTAVIEGKTVQAVTKEIRAIQNKSLFRAETIAITELAKATSQLNRKRFNELGITKAKWSTAKDDRVRPCHAIRDGKEYDLSKGLYSSCDGKYLQVGSEVRCRCSMLIV